MPSAIPLVKEGSIRALAVTSLKRSPAAPDIPTISESGLEGFNATSWFALLGPANLPKPILDKLNLETNRVLDTLEIKDRLLKLGLETNTGSPDQLNGFIKEESKKWSEVVKKSGAKAE
jgi:tripartite-type tricarboxylate transporter receptor subunit TctC